MPSLRVVTWNPGGEAGGRGAALSLAVTGFNATPPAVDLVAIQEAKVSIVPPGSVYAVLTGGAAPFAGFVNPPNHPRELNPPTQPYAVGKNKSYLISWRTGTALAPWLVPAGAAARVPLNAVTAPANGVENYITGLGVGGAARANLRLAAANIRAPVRKVFTFPGGGGIHNVFFYTWHADLQSQHLAASWMTVGMLANPFTGPGMYPAFRFFRACNTYAADLAGLTMNDVIIIAGDFNITGPDLGAPGIFPNYIGASNNLSHILAFSPSGNLAVVQAMHVPGGFPPHAIVSAEVQW